MHSKIYQVGLEPMTIDDYVRGEVYYDCYFSDYIGGDMYGKERKECIESLAKTLESIFDFDAGNEVFIFKGKAALRLFLDKWAKFAKEKAVTITPENIASHSTFYDVKTALQETHLRSDKRFCIEKWNGDRADPLSELIYWISSQNLKKGRKVYIGAVIDYHY